MCHCPRPHRPVQAEDYHLRPPSPGLLCLHAPIKGLYEIGVEIEENSELDLLVAYKAHKDDPRIPEICADMAKEMGEGRYYPEMNERMAQLEVTLLDWAEEHKRPGVRGLCRQVLARFPQGVRL